MANAQTQYRGCLPANDSRAAIKEYCHQFDICQIALIAID